MRHPDRDQETLHDYSKRLGDDYRKLYILRENGASAEEIAQAKQRIKTDKSILKNTVQRTSK